MGNISFFKKGKDIVVSYSRSKINNIRDRDEMKNILLLAYLRRNATLLGDVGTTINSIVEDCGYSIKCNSKPVNDSFRLLLKSMIKKGYIECSADIDAIKNNQFFKIHIVDEKSLFYCNDRFIQLNMDEFDIITKSETKSRKDILLITYLLIKQYIYSSASAFSKVAYPTKNSLLKSLNVKSYTTVNTAIDDLCSLGLIYKSDDYYYKENEDYIPCNKLYSLDQSELINSVNVLESIYGINNVFIKSEIDLSKVKYKKQQVN